MTPLKGKLIYKLITKQDGKIVLPDTAKNRSTSSMVVSINDNNSGVRSGDIIMHNMKYNPREEHFILNGEDHKIMDINDVFAKVIRAQIIPVNGWIFCKMIVPESAIAGVYKLKDCKEVVVCAIADDVKEMSIRIGGKYLLGEWCMEMHQINFESDPNCYMFLKDKSLVAEVISDNVISMF